MEMAGGGIDLSFLEREKLVKLITVATRGGIVGNVGSGVDPKFLFSPCRVGSWVRSGKFAAKK